MVNLQIDGDPIGFGELRDARVTVSNTTAQPILIRTVSLEQQIPFCLDLQSSLRGMLRYRESINAFDLYPGYPQSTPRVFADDTLLLPGEQTVFDAVPLRARFAEQGVFVYYQIFSFPELLRLVYFPRVSRTQTSRQRYELIPYSRIQGYRDGEAGTYERTVLVPDTAGLGQIITAVTDVDVPISDPSTPADVIRRAGASPGAMVTRWQNAALWIVDDPTAGSTFAVADPTGEEGDAVERIPLPRCDLRIFDLFDQVPHGTPSVTVVHPDGLRSQLISTGEIRSFLEAAERAGDPVRLDVIESAEGLPIPVVTVGGDVIANG